MLRKILKPTIKQARKIIKTSVEFDQESVAQQTQRTIVNQYCLAKQAGYAPYPNIRDAGFRVYSQFEEDGIILYVLAMIGFKSRRVVEMCCGTGNECMSANLILNHGFEGFLFDGSLDCIQRAKEFFANKKDCLLFSPTLTQAWITAEDVNDLISNAGCTGEVDLLSLDLDGNDYWIMRAIKAINPRLIIAECNDFIPSDRSITIPYDPNFSVSNWDYIGTSLLAMQRLCRQRGYRMIGAHRHGFNVLFLRNDEGEEFFPEVPIEQIHDNPWTRLGQRTRWPEVKDMPWEEV
jgi:hypothetical protein